MSFNIYIKALISYDLFYITYRPESKPGTNDRAVAIIPMVCNFELSNDTEDDTFTIEIKVKLKDVQELLQDDTDAIASLALGIQYTSHQIYVVDYPLDLRSTPVSLYFLSNTDMMVKKTA